LKRWKTRSASKSLSVCKSISDSAGATALPTEEAILLQNRLSPDLKDAECSKILEGF
jgi:hypothetical protein